MAFPNRVPWEFRNVTEAQWTMKIDDANGIKLNVGLRNEYQSQTDPGIDHNDLLLFGGLVIDF